MKARSQPRGRGGGGGGRGGGPRRGGSPRVPTRTRLVDAARTLLEEGGYAAASVQAIAARAGVAAGAMYRHFPSKADLFVDVFRDAAKRDMAAVDEAASTAGCVARLEAAVAAHARGALRHRRLAWALLHEPVEPLVDAERLAYRRTYCRHMAGLLRQAVAAGEIPEQNVELSAAAVVGAIAEALVGPLSPVAGQTASEEEIVATLVRFCRRSVGAPDVPALRRVPDRAGRQL
ncbi:MAG: TetR/AcrR family transcriptional regulator [bacterium]|nr:TetR/AcrR family transcriptional regulator [bacterium]